MVVLAPGAHGHIVGFPYPPKEVTGNVSCSGPYLVQSFPHPSDNSYAMGEGGWRAELRSITILSLVTVQRCWHRLRCC